ncbi:MAG: acyl transferase [Bacteroidetes bacterium HGW-Bacteroidetes-17]|jgi:phenylacetate-coenzyme A ligase PaaK-like adenylate-forming protein|nr:MAG: acyl transferase [Bacteroidetes bacterium HGW-Bacteroidetes-17]
MGEINSFTDNIFKIRKEREFEDLALQIFKYQFQNNEVYQMYIETLGLDITKIREIKDIPFLPIDFFKTHMVVSSTQIPEQIFTSSGTGGSLQSKHFVTDIEVYFQSFLKGFSHHYGEVNNYCLLALLPSYLEREGSSLVFMVNELIKQSNHAESGFYLDNHAELIEMLNSENLKNKKVLLIGVSYALLDLVENFSVRHPNLIVMETGGMKGRRKELIREELHEILKKGFGIDFIHSEYGMTELLSQAYSSGKGIFTTPPWMKILVRDPNDPFQLLENGQSGGINVIDLANLNSCSFIMTQDLGRITNGNRFEVLGRFDSSDIRGCNLLVD